MDKKIELKFKLQMLNRKDCEYYQAASVAEAVDVLIQCCEYLLGEQCESEQEE
jgi:hypothetical protein